MKKNKYAGQVKKRREAETLNASEKNMLAKVEQDRTLRQSLYHPIRVKAPDIPVDELIDYLQQIAPWSDRLRQALGALPRLEWTPLA